MKSQKKNTCIWTKYVLQDTVCIYMMLYYIVYIYIYIYMLYIYIYIFTWVSQTSWCPIMTSCLMSLHISKSNHAFFGGCLKGSGPLERSTSLLSQQVSMSKQTLWHALSLSICDWDSITKQIQELDMVKPSSPGRVNQLHEQTQK